MELSDYLGVLRDRWRSVVICTILLTAAGVVATVVSTPQYESRAQVFVSFQPSDPTSQSGLVSGSTYAQNQIASYVDLATSPAVLDPVIQDLGLPTTSSTLASDLVITSPADTVLINVVAAADQPQDAADIANAVARTMTEVIPQLETPDGATLSPVKLTIVREAAAAGAPSSPNAPMNVGLGLIAGLILGVGVAALRQALDTKIRTEDDVRRVTDAPVIGSIVFDDDAAAHPLIVQTSPHSARSEAFRRLRTNLQFLDVGAENRAIVITSAVPGEGKSTTAINLAISLADAGSRVVLVDADLRRPSVADYMGLERQVGLTTVLIGRAAVADVVQPWGNSRLHVITSGQTPPNPSELLGSRVMESLLKDLANTYDVVLLDTAPLLPVTDGAILARMTAGALLVGGAEKIHRPQLAQALERLATVDATVLGIVINRVARKVVGEYTYYEYTSSTQRSTRSRPSARGRSRRPDTAAVPRHANSGRGVETSSPAVVADESADVDGPAVAIAPGTTRAPSWPAISRAKR